MGGIKTNIAKSFTKTILKDLVEQTAKSKYCRAELILGRLLDGEKTSGWDLKCYHYYYMLKAVLDRIAHEDNTSVYLVKRVYSEYPIFKKALKPVLNLLLLSIDEYGITTPQKMSAPLLVEFEITKRCNLACKHCYANAGKPLKNELSTSEAKQVLDQISEAGVPIVCFTGGEPMLRKDFFELLEHAKKQELIVVITTNGTLITKEKAAKLKKLDVDYVRISLDGATPQTHDWFRGTPGAFVKTVDGIRNSVRAGVKTGIGTVIIQENVSELGGIIDLSASLGCCDINAVPLVESGRAKLAMNKILHAVGKEQKMINEKLIEGKAKEYEGKMLLNFLDLDHIRKAKGFSQVLIGWAQGGCAAGRTVCVISPDGDVRPCIIMWISTGNLREQRLNDIWKNSRVLEELKDRSLVKGKCGKCQFKNSCGGCRATAYEKYGDYLESDPSCYMRFL